MIQEMVAGLATRLEKDGGGREEWQRLIRSYWVLGRRNAALEALAGARRQFEGDEAELATLDAFARDLGVAP
jgi:cytochrome c-type biogenesis protein CcmH